ncbi:MAG: hypothetical protein H6703_00475 [Myxococcales bacterium]|nr:hypothetical protein [Myxococcales bacterium]
MSDEVLDRLLDADAPEPGEGFDARFFGRLAAEGAADLDSALDGDAPGPGAGFDARFFERLAAEGAADLDAALDADAPGPGAGFDERVRAAIAAEEAKGARVLRFPRRWAVGAVLAAAAAALLWVFARAGGAPEVPASELGLLAEMELLEVYDEMQVLDGIEDDETFELVAMLHTLDDEEALP